MRRAAWVALGAVVLAVGACGDQGDVATLPVPTAGSESARRGPDEPAAKPSEGVRSLTWADLVPEEDPVDDPFAALEPEQMQMLGLLVRVRTMDEIHPEKVTDGMRKEVAGYESELREQGVDIAGLLARREEIRAIRAARGTAVVDEHDGAEVRIPGYFLPLEYEEEKVIEFLLVPWVGACIHTPPPPPNQIVHVRLDEAIKAYGLFSPIWANGTLSTKATAKELFHVDGKAIVPTAYSMPRATATPYHR